MEGVRCDGESDSEPVPRVRVRPRYGGAELGGLMAGPDWVTREPTYETGYKLDTGMSTYGGMRVDTQGVA